MQDRVNFKTNQPVPVTYFFTAYHPDKSAFYPIDYSVTPEYCKDIGAECCSCTRDGHKCCKCKNG